MTENLGLAETPYEKKSILDFEPHVSFFESDYFEVPETAKVWMSRTLFQHMFAIILECRGKAVIYFSFLYT